MRRILLVSRSPENFADMINGLKKEETVEVLQASSRQEAMRYVEEMPMDVVIVDEELADCSGLEVISGLVPEHPLINCALVSRQAAEDFHELTEGLGLFMQLPPCPSEEDGSSMVEILTSIGGLLTSARSLS